MNVLMKQRFADFFSVSAVLRQRRSSFFVQETRRGKRAAGRCSGLHASARGDLRQREEAAFSLPHTQTQTQAGARTHARSLSFAVRVARASLGNRESVCLRDTPAAAAAAAVAVRSLSLQRLQGCVSGEREATLAGARVAETETVSESRRRGADLPAKSGHTGCACTSSQIVRQRVKREEENRERAASANLQESRSRILIERQQQKQGLRLGLGLVARTKREGSECE